MKNCLIIVDVQNDFWEGGSLAVPLASQIIPAINKIRGLFDLVVKSRDWHPKNHESFRSNHSGNPSTGFLSSGEEQIFWPDHCVQGTYGAEYHSQLNQNENDIEILKGKISSVESYSAFGHKNEDTGLKKILTMSTVAVLHLIFVSDIQRSVQLTQIIKHLL